MEAATKHLADLNEQRQKAIQQAKDDYAKYKDLKRGMKEHWKVNKRQDKALRKDIKNMKKAEKLEARQHASELAVLKNDLASYKKEIKDLTKKDKAAAALEAKFRVEHEKLLALQAKAAEDEDRRQASADAAREAALTNKAIAASKSGQLGDAPSTPPARSYSQTEQPPSSHEPMTPTPIQEETKEEQQKLDSKEDFRVQSKAMDLGLRANF